MTTHALPDLGALVRYVTGDGTDQRDAIVVGYPDSGYRGDTEAHLAVLHQDGRSLDLLALSVPHDDSAGGGTWHAPRSTAGWFEDAAATDPIYTAVTGTLDTTSDEKAVAADG